ncbi:hypothetical protein NBRC3222_2634 [Acetobacter pasteurianus NBRC 3222]|nr:hypothetical protein NBRC3222_2634 [Acetobacter pasteurianus NBRC 3222]
MPALWGPAFPNTCRLPIGITLFWSVGYTVRQLQTKETYEGQTIIDQVFCPFVGQIVQCLADQNFEHQNHIIGRTTAFAAICISKGLVQIKSKHLKIHSPGKGFELVTKPAQSGKPPFNIKENGLFHIASPPIRTEKIEAQSVLQNYTRFLESSTFNQRFFRIISKIFQKIPFQI